jgi:hypothetical protein
MLEPKRYVLRWGRCWGARRPAASWLEQAARSPWFRIAAVASSLQRVALPATWFERCGASLQHTDAAWQRALYSPGMEQKNCNRISVLQHKGQSIEKRTVVWICDVIINLWLVVIAQSVKLCFRARTFLLEGTSSKTSLLSPFGWWRKIDYHWINMYL